MPNMMAALPNIGGALCSTPQTLALTPTTQVPCSNAVNIGERKTWKYSELYTWQNSVAGQVYSVPAQETAKHHAKFGWLPLSSLNTTHSARNLFDEHLTFSDQITAISKACYYHIRQLRCIRPYLDSTTACTIATSSVHSKLDYCNSLYYNLPKSQITRLQLIQNSLARAVVNAPKILSHHSCLTLSSLAQNKRTH